MKTIVSFFIAILCIFSVARAQKIEISGFNGSSSTKEKLNDSTSLGEENYLGGSLKLFTNKAIGVVFNFNDINSRFDSLAYHRTHLEIGIGSYTLNDLGALKMYRSAFETEFTAGYTYDKRESKLNYVYDDSTVTFSKINTTQGAFANGLVHFYGNENRSRIFGSITISGGANLLLKSHFITRLGSDTLATKLADEDRASLIYHAGADVEIFSIALSEKLAIAVDAFASISNVSNYTFGDNSTIGGAIKLNCFSEKSTLRTTVNVMLDVVEFGVYRTQFANFSASGLYVKADLIALIKAIKKNKE